MLKRFVSLLFFLLSVMLPGGVGAQTVAFITVPTLLPRTTDLGTYSPLVGISYSGLAQERFTLKVWLLERDTNAYYYASSVWTPREYVLDNQSGANSAGIIYDAPVTDVYTYQNLLWVTRLYNSLGQEVAMAVANAASSADRPPVLNFIGNKIVSVNQSLDFVVSAPGTSLNFMARNLPAGATFNTTTRAFHWQPTTAGLFSNIVFQVLQNGLPALEDAEIISVRVVGTIPAEVGQWSAVMPWPSVPIHMSLLPEGQVLFWDRHDMTLGWDGNPYIWDPTLQTFHAAALPGWDVFCSGHTFLADGRLLVTGGHIADQTGESKAALYDSILDTWEPLPPMNAGRWYPTNVLLANGDMTVLSGTIQSNVINPLPQIWQPSNNSWRDLSQALLGAFPVWPDFYPYLYFAPNGKIFNAGPQQTARYLDTAGSGAWTNVANSSLSYRDYGSSVMYDDGKVLIVGGNPRDPNTSTPSILPSPTAEVINLNAASPQWRSVAPLFVGRRHLNTTLLPDGSVLATGGSSAPGFDTPAGAARHAELWNPSTETWTTLAGEVRYRGYHSNALLLPDGRVLVAGGGHPDPVGGTAEANAEIFSPPYLFKGTRPVITAAPTTVTYGQGFAVETPDAASIAQVTLIRLSSVTHAFNQNQRINRLTFAQTAGGLNVTAPTSAALCPPGHYMMFLLNNNGVPSVARVVRIASSPALADVSGKIALQGSVNLAQPVSLEFRPLDGTSSFVRTVTLTATGAFRLSALPRKAYRVHIKSNKNLAVTVNLDTTNGDVLNASALLRAGDANNDNAVDVTDLLILIAAYNKVAPNPGYLEAADFNSDGADDIGDLLLLIANYNQQGE